MISKTMLTKMVGDPERPGISMGFMYSADADGRGRTRTFSNFLFKFFIFCIFFLRFLLLAYIDLRGQLAMAALCIRRTRTPTDAGRGHFLIFY